MNLPLRDKEELNNLLGKSNKWFPKSVSGLNYVTGITEFDKICGAEGIFSKVPPLLNIKFRPEGMEIEILHSFKYRSIGIRATDIVSIGIEDKVQIIEESDKSIIGRALIGGVLLGPIGAIAGGLSGMGTKEVKANMPDLNMLINLTDGHTIWLAFKYKKRKEVEGFITSNFGSKLGI